MSQGGSRVKGPEIPMLDLKRTFKEIREEVMDAFREVLESGRYILGPKVESLEKEVARYCGVRYGIGVASGTDALHLSLHAAGVGPGDEVITTPFTFFATVEAILYRGAIPRFIDIEPDTMNLNPDLVEEAVSEKTKAILPVHLFGLPADMPKIMEVAKRYNLAVIEDAAQAFGASIQSRRVGSFGLTGCFSFYPSKNLGGCGDGGMVVTDDPATAEKLRSLRNHCTDGRYLHHCIGYNSRLGELQAAFLLVKLKRIDEYNRARRQKALFYTEQLKEYVRCPVERTGFYHVYHQYTIRTPLRDKLRETLKKEGIASVVYYPLPMHLQDAVRWLGYKEGDFPEAEKASGEVLSLPVYPELTEEQQLRVCEVIKRAVDG